MNQSNVIWQEIDCPTVSSAGILKSGLLTIVVSTVHQSVLGSFKTWSNGHGGRKEWGPECALNGMVFY